MIREGNTINGSKVAAGGVFYLALLILVQVFAIAQSPLPPQSYIKNVYRTGAVLWTQSAAEYRALAYQSFALARLRLNENLRINAGLSRRAIGRSLSSLHRPAIIVDIDETLLDNSRYQAELVLRGLPHDPQIWREWCQRAEAAAVPGAVDFPTHAARRRVGIFYVTNRRQSDKAGTVDNLQKLGFPDVSEKTLILREEGAPSSKESRRQQLAARYRVILLIGDSLSDFSDNFG